MASRGRQRNARAEPRRAERAAPAPAQRRTAFLTTQPGWAFATLAELRTRGVAEHVEFHHRDSTLVLSAQAVPRERLLTPADANGTLLETWPRGEWDATRVLTRRLGRADVHRSVTEWLARPHLPSPRVRPPWPSANPPASPRGRGRLATQWSVGAEVWGETQVQRRALREAVAGALQAAFPRWAEGTSGGVRLLVKADTRAALLGVQLYSNLEEAEEGRPGALREHLACGLLTLAGAGEDEGAVLDPFTGSGTILAAALRHFGVRLGLGAEIDGEGYRLARERLGGAGGSVRVRRASFDEIEAGDVPEGARLVSNLPFGARFEQVETRRLVRWLDRVAPRLDGIALLLARDQAAEVARALGLRVKNVLVLGQPAAITYGGRARI